MGAVWVSTVGRERFLGQGALRGCGVAGKIGQLAAAPAAGIIEVRFQVGWGWAPPRPGWASAQDMPDGVEWVFTVEPVGHEGYPGFGIVTVLTSRHGEGCSGGQGLCDRGAFRWADRFLKDRQGRFPVCLRR